MPWASLSGSPRATECHPDALLTNRGRRRPYAEEHMSTAHAIVEAPEQDVAAVEPDFEGIFREHYPTVYRTAYGVTGSAQDAEDVAQTVFLRLLHGRSREWKNPGAYLYRASVNESLTLIRSRRRQARNEDASRFPALAAHREAESADENHRRLYEAVAELGR